MWRVLVWYRSACLIPEYSPFRQSVIFMPADMRLSIESRIFMCFMKLLFGSVLGIYLPWKESKSFIMRVEISIHESL